MRRFSSGRSSTTNKHASCSGRRSNPSWSPGNCTPMRSTFVSISSTLTSAEEWRVKRWPARRPASKIK
ncbi:hypothetical protein ANTRET_LOCUS5486 [Anthophora retusa]